MPETIIAKRCPTCKEIKKTSEFSKARNKKDGLHSQCKLCRKAYNQSPKGKATIKAHRNSPQGKACQSVYWKSDAGIVARKRYEHSDKGKTTQKRYRTNNPEKQKGQIYDQ